MAGKKKITVVILDDGGFNCAVTSVNALEVVKSLLHSIKRNYIVVDLEYSATPKAERPHNEDYIVIVD